VRPSEHVPSFTCGWTAAEGIESLPWGIPPRLVPNDYVSC